MSKLVVCLGYNLQPDDSLHVVLINRLKDAVNLCIKDKNSTLLLMGSSRYGDLREEKISEASAMQRYLLENFNEELKDIKVMTEDITKSTVEQLCYLKKFIERENLPYSSLVIVSSKFFNERVKLYVEYIFGTAEDIVFIGSTIPADIAEKFKEAEEKKIEMAIEWLKKFKKGNDVAILKEQKDFQEKVIKGEIAQPPLS